MMVPLVGLAALALAVLYGLRLHALLELGADRWITTIPDDAFYYLVLAREHATSGCWSFDGGHSTAGFHLLHAYVLEGLFRLWPDLDLAALVRIEGAAASALLVAAFVLAARTARREFGPWAVLGVAWVFGSVALLQCQTFLLEVPWVVLLAAATVAVVLAPPRQPRLQLGAAFGTAMLASLARSDFGLLPAALAVTQRGDRRRRALWALLGACAGVGLHLLHNRVVSGTWLPSNIAVKRLWSETMGYDARPLLELLVCAVASVSWPEQLPATAVLVPGLVALVALGAYGWRRLGREPRRTVLGCAVAVAGWVAAYGCNAGIQPWYVAQFAVPLALLAGALCRGAFHHRAFHHGALHHAIRSRWPWLLVPLLLLAFAANYRHSLAVRYPNQLAMRAAGRYLARHPEYAPVGSWNAGIVRYFAGRPVINLDGLVNDEVVPYLAAGRLADYVAARGIRYLCDFGAMLEDRTFQRRGGYACGRLTLRAQPIARPARGESDERWLGTPMTLWALHDPPRYRLGSTLAFGSAGELASFAGCGWAAPERWGRWNNGTEATLELPLAAAPGAALRVEVELHAHVAPGCARQRIALAAGGRELGHWTLTTPAWQTLRVRVPAELVDPDRTLRLRWRLPDARSPRALGGSDDRRRLAIAVRSLVVR